MSGKMMGPRARSLVAACVVLGVGLAPALGKHAKVDPLAAARNDPHSSAWLNREAAKRARKAGLVTGKVIRPPRLATPMVNNPGADSTNQDTQSETTIADLGGGNLVAAFNDSGSYIGGANRFTGYSWSNDNGVSWNDAGSLPATAGGDAGDPILAYDQTLGGTGKLYFITLGFSSTALQMFTSMDKGHTFGPATSPGGTDADKAWGEVDNFAGSGQHNLYVCYTEFSGTDQIEFTRSIDNGATFSAPISLAGPAGEAQGCFVTVSPNHQVNVFYFYNNGSGSNDIFVRRSNDQGLTFAAAVPVAHLHTTGVNGDIGALGGFRTNSFPHAAVVPDPTYPFQYVVYNDVDPGSPANKSDVYMARSTDGGVSWSLPQRVNDDVTGDQFLPTIASTATRRLMVGYYSRSHDSANLMYHRRGVLGFAGTTGTVTFRKSFQMGPDTPVVIGQDPVINSVYMGDYDRIAANTQFFSSTWADNRFGNGFHARQPDVHYGRIAAAPVTSDLSVALTHSPAQIGLGENVTFTATVGATGGDATDVYLNLKAVSGLAIQSVNAPGASCTTINGITGCSLGTLAGGASRSIQIVATGVISAATRTFTAGATTSSVDSTAANNSASDSVVVNAGSTANHVYSTGNIAVAIPDLNTVFVPVSVADQNVAVRVRAYIRLNHTFDSDLRLTLISPTGKSVLLSNKRGSSGDNYGTGNNDCTGTFTVFDDIAGTSITAGTPPFDGLFKPEGVLSDTYNDPIDGAWKLKVEDTASGDIGTVGCVKLLITELQ